MCICLLEYMITEILRSVSDTLKTEHGMNIRKSCIHSQYIYLYMRFLEYLFNKF